MSLSSVIRFCLFSVCLISLLPVTAARAGQVFWSLNSYGPNRQSNGQPLPAGTGFQLGVFSGGFIPSAGNTAGWAAHWRSWDEIWYDPAEGMFSKEVLFDENTAPFTEGTALYCWGYVLKSNSQAEYFLATASTWTVPGTAPETFPVFVDLETAGTVILGAAHPGSGTISTASVQAGTAPPFLFADWRRAHFTPPRRTDSTVSGPEADPDGDGRSNLLEYLTGTPPDAADSRSLLSISAAAGGSLGITFPSPPSVRAEWEFETSTNLSEWEPATALPVYDPAAGLWRVSPAMDETRGFLRLRALAPLGP
ncbi:MAG: hypothetical protein V4726_09390 [Verrucomicrobiota bacterium]